MDTNLGRWGSTALLVLLILFLVAANHEDSSGSLRVGETKTFATSDSQWTTRITLESINGNTATVHAVFSTDLEKGISPEGITLLLENIQSAILSDVVGSYNFGGDKIFTIYATVYDDHIVINQVTKEKYTSP